MITGTYPSSFALLLCLLPYHTHKTTTARRASSAAIVWPAHSCRSCMLRTTQVMLQKTTGVLSLGLVGWYLSPVTISQR